MKKVVFIIAFGMSITIGCSPKLFIKKELPSNEIAVCLNISSRIPTILRHDIDSVTAQFIQDYNNRNKKYKLIPCQNDSNRTLFLNVSSIHITDPAHQALGVMLTTVDAITPILLIASQSPIYVWFAYLPYSTVNINMNLSKDISYNKTSLPHRSITRSNKYFGLYEFQRKLLMNRYYDKLKYELVQLEIYSK